MADRWLVVHGHFYQPPRENAWTESIETQPGAAPFRDWNERIDSECYLANACARVVDGAGRIVRLVNNYELLSFNVGPTLMSWLQAHAPVTYRRVIAADRRSLHARAGHGNAIAQAYNHVIMPLANARDRRTQIAWGIADFRYRFGRAPEAMWLPETAIDEATAADLVEAGMRWAILAPYQVARVRPRPDAPWVSVEGGRLDPTRPYLWRHPDGKRTLALLCYDGPLSQSIAFQGALAWGTTLMDRIAGIMPSAKERSPIVHTATDGETFGHHVKWGDRTIAYALGTLAAERGFRLSNYGEFLDHVPPTWEAQLARGPNGEGTAWSCSHGVGRWKRDCGCSIAHQPGWTQAWRAPLREGLDRVRDELARVFEGRGGELLRDPWGARDRYVEVVLDPQHRDRFLDDEQVRTLDRSERGAALTLLEMQRHAMLMYTSCGWFFDDIAGIEGLQILQYAARALEACEQATGHSPTAALLDTLATARSNQAGMGSGADVFRKLVDPARYRSPRVVADLAIRRIVRGHEVADAGTAHGTRYQLAWHHAARTGRLSMLTGRARIERTRTMLEEYFTFAALHLGGSDCYAVVRPCSANPDDDQLLLDALWADFGKRSSALLLLNVSRTLEGEEFALDDVIGEGRAQVMQTVYKDLIDRFAVSFARLYEDHHSTLEELAAAGLVIPPELRVLAEFILGRRLAAEIEEQHRSDDLSAYARAIAVARETLSHGYTIDRAHASQLFGRMLESLLDGVAEEIAAGETDATLPDELEVLREMVHVSKQMRLDLTRPQNRVWELLLETRVPVPAGLTERLRVILAEMGFAPETLAAKIRTSMLPPPPAP